jgi:hypothetical protein
LDVIHIDSIADQWDDTDDDDVMSYTDTDLLLARNWSTRFHDADNMLQPLIRTVMAEYPVTTESEAMDMALRVGIAKAIDDKITVIDRKQFDIKYSIPPRGWVDRQRFSVDAIVTVPPDEQSEYLSMSGPPVCKEMCHALCDEGVFNSITDIEQFGLEILIGHEPDLPIVLLFRYDSMVSVMDFFIDDSDPTEWYRKSDVNSAISFSRESIRQALGSTVNVGPLVLFGIVDINSTDVSHPRYQVANTNVVSVIREYRAMDTTPSAQPFFNTSARRQLTQFFLFQADPETTYSHYSLQKQTPVSYRGVSDNMDQFVDAGIVSATTDHNDTRQYSYNPDTDFHQFCLYLNKKLNKTCQMRREQYE